MSDILQMEELFWSGWWLWHEN